MLYNGASQLLSYQEKTTDADGYQTDALVNDMTYNSLGQLLTRREKVVTTALSGVPEVFHDESFRFRDHIQYYLTMG